MDISSLVIETTRKCNLRCVHCLRGPIRNETMKPEFVKELLSQIDYISAVTFTGGEPTLPSGLKTINEFIDWRPDVGSFYMVTNGKSKRSALPETLERLWNLCDSNEITSVDVSEDNYHNVDTKYRHSRSNFQFWLEETMLYEHVIELPMNRKKVYNVLSQGSAKDWGTKEVEEEEIVWRWSDESKTSIAVVEGTIYLNCKGEIISGCDWSYNNQKHHKICDVIDDIQAAIIKYKHSRHDEDI